MHAVAAWLVYQLAPFCGRHMLKVASLRLLPPYFIVPMAAHRTQSRLFADIWLCQQLSATLQ